MRRNLHMASIVSWYLLLVGLVIWILNDDSHLYR